ncbi:translationally-controlled tumor protein [Petromyzon marinus]|uniref:Translationally-controlled tumor protein n=2 Tax=Petromyzontidae TaxID=7746 RepID=S4RX85_PETMA|nr:translationally-controlled tumor protein [Petromyzon marinus]XP_061426255.1 translationally-controlled tumor protein [Lethenteron reissneri]ACA05209.1 histamine releasing factor [Lethenteron camtschaticum]
MIIYKDILTGDEMFSDIYKIKETADGACFEVEGTMVSRVEGDIDDAVFGGNASAEGGEFDSSESSTVSGVDIVLNHKLQETSFSKEKYIAYIKAYMKTIKENLMEKHPEKVEPFMTAAAKKVKDVLKQFKDFQFFTGESMNPDGMVALLNFREDGITPYMLFFKDGLEIEKC